MVAAGNKKNRAGYLFGAGLICNCVSLTLRYWISYPLLPLYQGPFFLPAATGVAGLWLLPSFTLSRIFIVTLLAGSALFFPNDFYLPVIQFNTLFAHGFFLFGVMGQALFLVAGAAGAAILAGPSPARAGRQVNQALLWGFFFWTLSVFSGGVWSWLGWGSPVVWDDPLMTCAMATWLLYAFLLHLHLTRFSSARARAWALLGGALFVFFFNHGLALGRFHLPRGLS
jgi:hypothetical protein